MGELSIWHWLIVLIVVMLLFGSGKVSTLMGDVAKGVKAFRRTMAEDDPPASARTAEDGAAEDGAEAQPNGSENGEKDRVSSGMMAPCISTESPAIGPSSHAMPVSTGSSSLRS
ncbi:MAG TPA: twin-arginine translocase TatA/TatE family subunit [Acetobacteraceae bacterium]|nr:twin-arginine translocase TatA/TatE family subunit [Acetobacteraceae bacterium]